MNEGNLKILWFIGLALQVISYIFIIGIPICNHLFVIQYIIPDFIITTFKLGIFICLITPLLQIRIKNK